MERNFNKSDFEDFIQQNADQYRMFPSEKVWNKIHGALHTRRKWYGIGLATLLLSTVTAVTSVMLSYPSSKKVNDISPLRIETPEHATPGASPEEIQQVLAFSQPNKTSTAPATERNPGIEDPRISLFAVNQSPDPLYLEVPNTAIQSGIVRKQASPSSPTVNSNNFNLADESIFVAADEPEVNSPALEATSIALADWEGPFTIESVTNAFHAKKQGKKLSWQFFFSPTVSYRKLSENSYYRSMDAATAGSYPFNSAGQNLENAVTHKPDLGLEIGLTTRYAIAKNVNLRTGLQFNIRRYDIKAFAYRGELANIDLTGASGSTTAWTYYRTRNGYKADWLKNFYLTVSVPVGAELKLFGNNKTNVGIAGTVQPTYIISDRAYLISTDYKNYAKVPSLIRHVNLNTSFETFVNYTTGKTHWQVGPQIRYQVLSSFQNKYPVRENLFDFGLRVGVLLDNH